MRKITRNSELLIDLAVVLAFTAAGFFALGGVDFFEWWHTFTRDHEDKELDELASGLVGLALGLIWFSVRRWRAAVRVLEQTKSTTVEMREREERFRSLFEYAAVGIAVSGLDGRFLRVNQSLCDILGYTEDELLSMSFREVMHPDDVQTGVDNMKEVLAGKRERFSIEKRYVRKNGATVWADLTVSATRSDGGEILNLVAFVQDITGRKAAELAAHEAEARFRAIAEATPIALVITRPKDGAVLYANAECEQLFGLSVEQLAGKNSLDFWADPASRDAVVQKLMRDGVVRNFETRVRDAAGNMKWVMGHAKTLLLKNQPAILAGFFDVTERREIQQAVAESEERFRAVIDNSPNAILLKDLDSRYLLVNKVFEERYGLSKADALGKTSYDVCDKARADALSAHDADVLETLRPVQWEHEIVFPDGVAHTLFMTKFPVFDGDGAPSGIGSISVDMTEHYRIEGQLRQAQKMEAVGQLTGGVAHDFNNLLAVITGNLELISEALPDDQDLNEMTERALRAADRGSSLTQRLLAFSRKQVLQPKPTDLNDLVAGILDLLRRTLGEDIGIELHAGEDLWACEADAGQLENATLNLAVNARDAMPTGGTLTIETENVVLEGEYAEQAEIAPGAYVMLAVSDSGVGMSSDVIEHAFEPFFTTKKVGEGTGLGLSMVYGFAKQSNGHATVYSEEGKGTTVKIYLPRVEAQVEAEAAPGAEQGTEQGTEQQIPAANGETVLVVEDDPNVRTLVVTMLESLDYTVVEAANGHAARAILDDAAAIDVLLTDVVLAGGISGPEIAEDVRRRRPEIAILFMSGYAANAKVTQAHLSVGDRLLQKPFRKPALARMMREALAGNGAAK